MKLLYSLPEERRRQLRVDAEEFWYCVPYDLSEEQNFVSDSYVIVTKERIVVSRQDEVVFEANLRDCKQIVCESLINNGILTVWWKDAERTPVRIARFSMRWLVPFSYIARGATMLSQGNLHKVVSRELDNTCPKCGYALPGIRVCPHCNGRQETLRKMRELCRPYIPRFLLVTALMVLGSIVSIAVPKVQQQFIDSALLDRQGGMSDVLVFVAVMLLLTVLSIVITIASNWYSTVLGAGMSYDLRAKMFQKIQRLSLSFVQERKPGELMNRIVSDTVQIRRFLEGIFSDICAQLFKMVGAMIVMALIDVKLLLWSLVFAPVVLLGSMLMDKQMRTRFRRERNKSDVLNSQLQDVISGMSVVKSFGKEQEESVRFQHVAEDNTRVQISNNVFFACVMPCFVFVLGLGVYVATYFGGLRVLDNGMTPGMLMQFVSYVSMMYAPLNGLVRFSRIFSQMLTSMERIYDILDEPEDSGETRERKAYAIDGDIEFRNVTFGYKTYEPVLTHIDLTVKKGEMIGLVGASGSGKTTLINLLMGLYEVDDGELYLNGKNIAEIDRNSLHSQIGVVLQETFLFNGTILDNIRYAKPDATYDEIIRAAKAANAHDFICRTPDGYETYVGERGYTLSGGERQRIAIARAVLNQPKLLILDEATSSLDTESEYLVQKALDRLMENCTTVAIAHRLSTLRSADRLVVIDGHRIAEIGTHEELLQKKGIYYGLVMAQLQMSKVTGEAS